MKNKGIKLMNFRAFSIGASVAVLALACGSDSGSNNDDDNGGEDDVVIDTDRETCEDNPLLAGCALPDNDDDGNPIAPPDPVDNTPPPGVDDNEDPAALARAAAETVLEARCGQCHGPNLSPQAASAGMNFINDVDALVADGKIVPLNSDDSPIIQRMRNGSMPPPTSQLDRVPDNEINTVAQFIDNPRFWDGVEPVGNVCPDQLFDFDTLYREVAQDLQSLDDDDQLTARYISLTNRFTAGVCADVALDKDRQALFKMLNALSTETTVETPTPINADETIYRIDIEDFGFEEPVTVVIDGVAIDFADKWEMLAANNPYAVPFEGDDVDDAVADSGTAFPVMFADSLLDTAAIGNVYYAMIGVDVQQTIDDFIINELQIDVDQNLLDGDQVRAGTTRSIISRQDRVVQRDEIEIRQGVLWQSFDFLADDANESIFEDPFNFAEGGREAIFTLPNGMLAFIIADENGAIVEDSDILLDTSQANFRAVTSVSCSRCHEAGFIEVADEVRDIALQNARVIGLNADEVEQLREVYPDAAAFARIIEDDSRLFQSALSAANVPVSGADPLSDVFLRFDNDMRLADAAGDLGLRPDELEADLNILQPELQVLDTGTLDRDDFTAFYVDSLCLLQSFGDNVPNQQLCADVAANGGLVP